jgi:hypothetical protein
MRPFNATEVTKYLLWVVLALALAAILAWYLFYSPGHERLHSGHPGATVYLRAPKPAASASAG